MSRSEWQSPPGWPPPPRGFRPPAGWLPDPSWPPAPADWVWLRRPPLRRRMPGYLAVGLVAVLFLSLVGAEVADEIAGCGSVDPTDAANFTSVLIANDTSRTVRLDACRGACASPDDPIDLVAGASTYRKVDCSPQRYEVSSWRVRSSDGRLLGYLAVAPRRSDDEPTLLASTARATRTLGSSSG